MKKFRWAFIGASTIASNVAKMILPTGRHEIIGIWNRTMSKAIDFSTLYHTKIYKTLDELWLDKDIDAIYITVTTNIHYELIMTALSHKIPVLVEKPFTINHLQANAVFNYALKQNVYVTEAMWTWFNDTAINVKKWLNEGLIGDVKHVKIDYSLPLIHYLKSPRLEDVNQCGGALMDIGVYPIHYAIELFGLPKNVLAKGDVKNGVDYKVDLTLEYESFCVEIRIAMDRFDGERFTAYGTLGYIRVPWFHMYNRAYACTKNRNRKLFVDSHGKGNDLLIVEFDRVASEINAGKITSEYVTPTSVINTFKVMDDIRQQIGVVFPREMEFNDEK